MRGCAWYVCRGPGICYCEQLLFEDPRLLMVAGISKIKVACDEQPWSGTA
jgi:hypothetical protein